jgi:plasmid stabilization system protein ParE
MALTIIWSKRATLHFEKIFSYLLVEWGEKAAKEFIVKVYDFLETLAEFPEIGSFENKENNIRGFPLLKQVTIFYRIKNNKIFLIHFFDNRQNPVKKKL